MAKERRPVDDLASAILDGAPVNWEAVEATSPAPDRDLIPHLRLVARIADAHRIETPRGAAPPEGPPLESWGHLKIVERIGSGAFGEVYRAWDTRLDRQVALKLLNADDSAQEGTSVIAEGSLLARLRHPNVVTVYGAERIQGRVGLWMEFIAGRGLHDLVREQGPFSAHEAALIGMSVCSALSAVHRAGLLHRDVKAQNVMREEGGRVVLMDFGTSLLAEGGAGGGVAGTPLYLAPELFAGGEATMQSDVYSVGVLLFHLATGSFPVRGYTLPDLREAHDEDRRRFLRDERPDLPHEFVAVVEKAMAAAPGRRFASAGAMESALARAVGARTRSPRDRRAVWALGSLGAVVATVLILGGATTWREATSGWGPDGVAAGRSAKAAAGESSVVIRKVPLPPGYLVGRPSADGRWISFSDGNGNAALFETTTADVRVLTSAAAESGEHAMFTVISADGGLVAYSWRALDGKYELRVIGADGKRPRVLLRSESGDEPVPLVFTRDGTAILSILTRTDGTRQLAFVATEDGDVRRVLDVGSQRIRDASVSPDGTSIVYDAADASHGGDRDIFIVGAGGGDPRPLLRHPANDVAPAWTPDGTRVVFASDRSGAMDLWSVAVAGVSTVGEPDVVHRGIGRMSFLGLTDEGDYFYQAIVGTVDVYAAELPFDGQVGKPQPLGPSYAGSNISSLWSPDGRQVAYASRRGLVASDHGSTTLIVRDLESGESRELVPELNSFLLRWWSPDGRHTLVNATDGSGTTGMFAVDMLTARARLLRLGAPRVDMRRGEEWPETGRFLYPRGRELRVRDFEQGTDTRAVDLRAEGVEGLTGGPSPGWHLAPDGRTVAFTATIREGDLMTRVLRVKSPDQPSRELVRAREVMVMQDWAPDGAAVFFTRYPEGKPAELWRASVNGEEVRFLGLAMKGLRDVRVHPDGRRITFTAGWPSLEVWVIENLLSARP